MVCIVGNSGKAGSGGACGQCAVLERHAWCCASPMAGNAQGHRPEAFPRHRRFIRPLLSAGDNGAGAKADYRSISGWHSRKFG
jgi:hypothetical protein